MTIKCHLYFEGFGEKLQLSLAFRERALARWNQTVCEEPLALKKCWSCRWGADSNFKSHLVGRAQAEKKKQKQNRNDSSKDWLSDWARTGKDSVSEHRRASVAFRLTQGCCAAECLSYLTFYTYSVVFLWPGVGFVTLLNQELSPLML